MNGPAALGANSFLPLLGNWITTVSLPSRFIAARSTLLLSTQIQPIKPLSDIWGEVQLPSVVNSSLWPSENVTRILPVWIVDIDSVGQAPGGRIMVETDKMPVHLHRSSKWNAPCLVWTQCHRIDLEC